jgi:hypothetical protein
VKGVFISAAAILAFASAVHADELSDIQAQAKQIARTERGNDQAPR